MKIAIGSDHRGYNLKSYLKNYLNSKGYDVIDFGTDSEASVDYPDYAKAVCEYVAAGNSDFGITICGSGIGISIASNKVKGARAVNLNTKNMAEMSRRHNNANIACFGSDFIDNETASKYIETFLNTAFEGGERHERRVQKLNEMCG